MSAGAAAGFTALAATAALAAGCGSSQSSGSSATTAASSGSASSGGSSATVGNSTIGDSTTVFDGKVAAAAKQLPAISVPVGDGQTIKFAKGEKLKVAYVGYGLGFDYTAPQYDMAKEMAAKYGFQLDTFDSGGDPQKQVAELQDVLNSGKYNTVVAYADDPGLDCNLLTKQLPAKNILVVVHTQSACPDKDSTPGVVTSVWDTGALADYRSFGQKIVADAPGRQKAIIITGPKGDSSSDQAVAAISQAFAGHIPIAAVERTNYTTPDSQTKAQDAIQTHSDATMIIATFPEGSRGAISAVRIAGKAGKMRIYDFGGAKTTVDQLATGIVTASSPQYPATTTKTAFQAAILARAGQKVPPVVYNAGVKALPSGQAPWVTKANVSQFHAEY